ncbi:acetylglutamate kinase [Salinispira pacifica]|uniref:Acetylglutamate kinase n=1 Tax=Salinispira pacifica TaxID=1307761 RepID=V5WMI0_9SPIO|nr:acetylglutamate kinase [Salinispira pacifica]AHC16371.1 Acetylglutamate kinase [Salinispira pacifica]
MRKPGIIKIGGRCASDMKLIRGLLQEIRDAGPDRPWILVHGGGDVVSTISRKYGVEPRFIDGIRQTGPHEMELIDMGLAGVVNTSILRMAAALGIPAVGISGVDAGLISAEPLSHDNHTGRVTNCRPDVIFHLLNGGYLPVISPVSSGSDGSGLNVNADDAALAIAGAIRPENLVFISDIPGVMNNGERIPELNADMSHQLIQDGIISGGMIPKVQNALAAVESGCGEAVIGDLQEGLAGLLANRRGTRFPGRS